MGQWLLPSCFSKGTEAGWKHMPFSCFDKNALFTSQNCFLWHNRHGNPNNSRGFRRTAGLTITTASGPKKICDMIIIVLILKSRIFNQTPLFLPDMVLDESEKNMQKFAKRATLWKTFIVCQLTHQAQKKYMMVQVREEVKEPEQPLWAEWEKHLFCKACTAFFWANKPSFNVGRGPSKYMCTILKWPL